MIAALPDTYWALLLSDAAWVRNRVFSGDINDIPFRMVTANIAIFLACAFLVALPMSTLTRIARPSLVPVRGGMVSLLDEEDAVAWLIYNSRTRRVLLRP